MTKSAKAEVATVSEKGQVVIPQAIRRSLGIAPKARLLVYGYKDSIVMRKLEVPDVRRSMEAIWTKVDERIAKFGELTREEIDEIIHTYRKRKSHAYKKVV